MLLKQCGVVLDFNEYEKKVGESMKKRALLSVYDKTNIVAFAKALVDLDFEVVTTGGTYQLLKKEEVPVTEISDITQFKEMLDGRVKTLHPIIHGGILYRRSDEEHVKTVEEEQIVPVDIVVNNLYPFEQVLNANKSHEELIENIDIGGPSMIRAAAKNHEDVLIVTDVNDYDTVIEKLQSGQVDLAFRRYLAGKAFNYTAYYDALIANYFNDLQGIEFPERLTIGYKKRASLRYGENPHQQASWYDKAYVKQAEKTDFVQLHGKELSYNNLTDSYGAIKMVKEFSGPAVVAVKHANPCGIGTGETIEEAFDKAYACDDVSIFGGIVAFNRPLNKDIAEKLSAFFVEIVIAPSYEEDALAILTQKKNIRLMVIDNMATFQLPNKMSKEVLNGMVYQDADTIVVNEVKVVTKVAPTEQQMKDLLFAFKACKTVSSNGIVLAKNGATLGIGQGEVRRSWACEQALNRMNEHFPNSQGAVMASDAFFFEDTVELLKENGVQAVIQPGGSIRDEKVIQLCDEYGIAMVFTTIRHFRH